MKELFMNDFGDLILKGRVVGAVPIGEPRVLWGVDGSDEPNLAERENIMEGFGGVASVNQVPNAYLFSKK